MLLFSVLNLSWWTVGQTQSSNVKMPLQDTLSMNVQDLLRWTFSDLYRSLITAIVSTLKERTAALSEYKPACH